MATTNQEFSRETRSRDNYNGTGLRDVQIAKCIYNYAVDGGVISTIVPRANVELPAGSVIFGGTANATTALASAASNITIGTSAGSSSSALLGSTNKTSFSTNALINLVPIFATPVKLTAKGKITFTTSGTLTAGVVEIVLYYYVAKA